MPVGVPWTYEAALDFVRGQGSKRNLIENNRAAWNTFSGRGWLADIYADLGWPGIGVSDDLKNAPKLSATYDETMILALGCTTWQRFASDYPDHYELAKRKGWVRRLQKDAGHLSDQHYNDMIKLIQIALTDSCIRNLKNNHKKLYSRTILKDMYGLGFLFENKNPPMTQVWKSDTAVIHTMRKYSNPSEFLQNERHLYFHLIGRKELKKFYDLMGWRIRVRSSESEVRRDLEVLISQGHSVSYVHKNRNDLRHSAKLYGIWDEYRPRFAKPRTKPLDQRCVYMISSMSSMEVYFGLTNDYEQRMSDHGDIKRYSNEDVLRIMTSNDDVKCQVLVDYTCAHEAADIERKLIADARDDDNWVCINKDPGGSLGGYRPERHTVDRVMKVAKSCSTRKQFREEFSAEYNWCKTNNRLQDVYEATGLPRSRPSSWLSNEERTKKKVDAALQSEIRRIKRLTAAKRKAESLPKLARNAKKVFKHWTRERVLKESLNFYKVGSFKNGSPGAYKAAKVGYYLDVATEHMRKPYTGKYSSDRLAA